MSRHHYVPQFLLRRWGSGDVSGKFVSYHYEEGARRVIENSKSNIASACQIKNLNTFFGVKSSDRDFPETRYFTPRVDTPAAVAHRVILDKGVRALTPPQRTDWARLVISFGVRTPETLRKMGPQEVVKAFDLLEATSRGPLEGEKKVSKIIQANLEGFKRNFPLSIAMELIADPHKLAAVEGMTWWIRRWPRDCMLIGDSPLLAAPRARYPCGIPLDSPDCSIVLPIAPDAVFFASASLKTKDKVRKMAPSRIARIVNEEMIWRSSRVYFSDTSLGSFVEPRIIGKVKGTWQPSKL